MRMRPRGGLAPVLLEGQCEPGDGQHAADDLVPQELRAVAFPVAPGRQLAGAFLEPVDLGVDRVPRLAHFCADDSRFEIHSAFSFNVARVLSGFTCTALSLRRPLASVTAPIRLISS